MRSSITGCTFLIAALALQAGAGAGDAVQPRQPGRTLELQKREALGDDPAQPPPGVVELVHATLSDNVDDDGWADTNETVAMSISLYNRTGSDVTNLVARLSTSSPEIACISDALEALDFLAAGATVHLPAAFTFQVADVSRTSPADTFSADFTIALDADLGLPLPRPALNVTIDLDLDAAGGSGPTTWLESFEDGFGTFEEMELDRFLNPPPEDPFNHEMGLQNADGFRCPYYDPDWQNSIVYGNFAAYHDCYPGVDGIDAYWFHTTADRAFSGSASLHWGAFVSESEGFTSPTSQLEAIRTTDPIYLGRGKACESDPASACTADADCPGGSCAAVTPVLSFKHQISLLDHRGINAAPGTSSERAIVAAQLADENGEPVGDWIRLVPYVNVYDTLAMSFFNCEFDPIDDGNTEESFFDPSDPNRILGPSSTCKPLRSFADQGDTFSPFDPADLGDASDGPGLEGSTGLGTWVEPRISLARFQGRGVRLRFLATGQKIGRAEETWQTYFLNFNPDPSDDGWFIDAVTITDAVTEPATIVADTKENVEAKGDRDLDGFAAVCDCAPEDETAWDVPGEVTDLRLAWSRDQTLLSWSPPTQGGTAFLYDTLRAASPNGFASAECVESGDGTDTEAVETGPGQPGTVAYFLVRARHACGAGSPGDGSNGLVRVAGACP